MIYKKWKQYDPEHLKYIQTMIDDPYTDVPKQDVIFLMDRLQQSHDREQEAIKERDVWCEKCLEAQHRERVLRDALEEVVNPIHKIHWGLVDPGDPNCHCTVCRKIRSALEASK